MLSVVVVKVEEVYVPLELRKQLDPEAVEAMAEKIMAETQNKPIQVRRGKGRYVLVKGVHRLEAGRALGEETIEVYIVGTPLH